MENIAIEQPINSESHYHNYKEICSTVLLAMVGPEYEFWYANVGINDLHFDSGIWGHSLVVGVKEVPQLGKN